MMTHKPTILYLTSPLDHDFQEFEDGGAILVARNKEELLRHGNYLLESEPHRQTLVEKADYFLRKNFMFDGESSRRVATCIRTVQ